MKNRELDCWRPAPFPTRVGVNRSEGQATEQRAYSPHPRGGARHFPSSVGRAKGSEEEGRELTFYLNSVTLAPNEARRQTSYSSSRRVRVSEGLPTFGFSLPLWLTSPAVKAGEVMYWIPKSWCVRLCEIWPIAWHGRGASNCLSYFRNFWHRLSFCATTLSSLSDTAHWTRSRNWEAARSPPDVLHKSKTHFSAFYNEGGVSIV